ncbi:hypothetical protein L195_g062142, partial [Trifolium pratense]
GFSETTDNASTVGDDSGEERKGRCNLLDWSSRLGFA